MNPDELISPHCLLALCSQFAAAYITDDPNDPLRCIPSKTPIVYHYNATFTGSKFYYSQDSDTLTVKNHTYATAAYEQTDTIKFVKQVKGVTPSTISVRYAVNALSWSIGELSPSIVSSHTTNHARSTEDRKHAAIPHRDTHSHLFPSRTHVILHFHPLFTAGLYILTTNYALPPLTGLCDGIPLKLPSPPPNTTSLRPR